MARAPALPLPPDPMTHARRRGRPARLDRERSSVYLDPVTKGELVRRAAERRATLSDVIAEAVRLMLEGERRAA